MSLGQMLINMVATSIFTLCLIWLIKKMKKIWLRMNFDIKEEGIYKFKDNFIFMGIGYLLIVVIPVVIAYLITKYW